MSVKPAAAKFPAALSGLKRRGGGILVVGEPAGQRRVCGRLLGAPERERVVVSSGESTLTADCDHGATLVRGGPAQTTACHAGTVLQSSSLADRVVDAIRARGHGLEPAALRVCLGSVGPDSLRSRTVFLDAVLEELQGQNALGHVHVPAARDSDLVRRLEPLFDATVAVRADPRPSQRWVLHDQGVTTDWIDLG